MMKKNALIHQGMRIAVIGLGVSGRAAVRYFQACGAEVVISDSREEKQFLEKEELFLQEVGVAWEAGGHSQAFFRNVDMVFVSPGVPLNLPLLNDMRELGVPVLGELAVAAPVLDEPVIAITGTNGKTTVTTLIGQLLAVSEKNVFVGGNIGTPLFNYLINGKEADAVILEVSSFQLDTAGDFHPVIALLLNITPDHLDRHGSLDSYTRAKMKIFTSQMTTEIAVFNGDDPLCRRLAVEVGGKVLMFGHEDDCDAKIVENRIVLRWQEEEVYDLSGSRLANPTGLLNAAAAVLAARAAGCSPAQVLAGLMAFEPLHHRMEPVAEIKGVVYYDDSKATNTGAVLTALAQIDGKVILIAGGRDKGDDYTLLRESVRNKARKVILIGESAVLIERALAGTVPLAHAASMDEAVELAHSAAQSGDAVLLSPACASFDMFNSYAHRGEVFAAAVKRLSPVEEIVADGGRP